MDFVVANTPAPSLGAASTLKCGKSRTAADLDASYACTECFGPLEVAYDFADGHPRRDRGRARGDLALRGAAARRAGRIATGPNTEPGFTPLIRADRLGAALGSASSGSRTTPPTRPTPSRTASSRSRSQKAASSASRTSPAPRPATSPTPSPPPPRARGLESVVFIPSDLEEQKIVATARLRRQPGRRRRQLRRRQPALHRARGRTTLGVRQRQPAPVLRRGLQDARLRDRRAARLADCPTASSSPIASRLAAHQDRTRRSEELHRARPGRGPTAEVLRRPGRRLLPGRAGAHGGRRRQPPGEARHDRQVARDRQPGRRPLRARRRPQHRRRGRRVTDDEIVEGIRLLARTAGIFTETAGGVTIAVLRKLLEPGEHRPRRGRR